IRFRASFFPFTEPSAEIDTSCFQCAGNDAHCRLCKGSGWLEILGSGLIDPNVFEAVGYDPETVSGFAFGMAAHPGARLRHEVQRVAMVKQEINDIRLLFANDVRFLRQF